MQTIVTEEQPITLNQALEFVLKISKPKLRQLIRDKKIRHHRLGRRYLFFKSELVEDLKSL